MRYLKWLTLATVAFALTGCGSDPVAAPPGTLSIVAGNQQTGDAGAALPIQLTIKLVNEQGEPAGGRTVHWRPTGASVTPGQSVTDGEGRSSASVVLGPIGGTATVRVSSESAEDVIFTLTVNGPEELVRVVATIPVPANYGVHDTYIRDGIAFVAAWNTGVRIYDVGNGIKGGLPSAPALISTVVPGNSGLSCVCAHNSWWFHNPTNGEKRYLFVGQEAPAVATIASAGDIHVIDVSNLNAPVEVATLGLGGVGVHNFWMDEARQILYAAYYDGGVIAVDVSGTLTGSLFPRIVARVEPAGEDTYVWGVKLHQGKLLASDMRNGLWALDPVTLATAGGGNNYTARWTSEVWAVGNRAYTGTWSLRFNVPGNQLNIWNLDGAGIPTLADSIRIGGVSTVSDVNSTPDGKVLVVTGETGTGGGLYLYRINGLERPTLISATQVSGGLHTGKTAVINGRTYVFGARNPGASTAPALVIYDITAAIVAAGIRN